MSRHKVNRKCTACSHCSPPSWDKETRQPIFRCEIGHVWYRVRKPYEPVKITLRSQFDCKDFSRA